MFERLGIFFSLFRMGNEVANVEMWKKHQITATILAPFLTALLMLAKSYGYEIPLSNEDLLQLAGGIVVVVNLVLTLITSKRAGLLPNKPPAQPVGAMDGTVPAPSSAPAAAPAGAPDSPAPQDPVEEPPVQPVSSTDPRKDIYFG